MSLLDNARKEAQVGAPVATGTATETATGKEVAKKSSNASYQKKQRELLAQNGKIVNDYIKTLKNVPQEVVEAAEWLGREKKASAAGSVFGKPVLYKIFGNTPKVGDKVTALKVFEETGKGFAEMRQLMKKWLEKQNVTVVYDEKTKSYSISAGSIPAYVEA